MPTNAPQPPDFPWTSLRFAISTTSQSQSQSESKTHIPPLLRRLSLSFNFSYCAPEKHNQQQGRILPGKLQSGRGGGMPLSI
uniref:HDC08316 n=1 Tax=Drosophila melanogaster TaxID=7227 RepID=Q6ILU5_DROME|nr:TPA_inf: HDC08316 [Drosophila melanogaster]